HVKVIPRSRYDTKAGIFVHLIPSDSNRKEMEIPQSLKADSFLWAWLSDLPDLDEPDMREELSEVTGNPLLGSSREERIQRNTNATWTAAWLQIVVWFVAMCT